MSRTCTDAPRRRNRPARGAGLALLAALLGLAGCGREAPVTAPGDLTVTSEPPGAAIALDDVPTGEVTPHTFVGLEAGVHAVSVDLPGWVAAPARRTVDLQPLDRQEVAFALSQTGVRVESSPAGARILVDGVDSGLLTPAVVTAVAPGPVRIALALDHHVSFPADTVVTVVAGEVAELGAATFLLRPLRTVMLEGFANVDCGPCPQMTANLLNLTADAANGPERVLFLEFSVSWPDLLDPFFQANVAENRDRYLFYQVAGAPTLVLDGGLLADAVDNAALRAAVAADLADDPGVLVDVTADLTADPVQATVTLVPLRPLDLSGHQLFVALYEDLVVIDPAPGDNGQTEFHHVFRDRVDTVPALGALAAGQLVAYPVTLRRDGRDPDRLVVVAFIQDPATHAVLQAGSSLVPAVVSAAAEGQQP